MNEILNIPMQVGRRRKRLRPTERRHLHEAALDGPFSEEIAADVLGLLPSELDYILEHDPKAVTCIADCKRIARGQSHRRLYRIAEEAATAAEKRLAYVEFLDRAHGPIHNGATRSNVQVVLQLPAALDSSKYGAIIEQANPVLAAE